MVKVLRVVLELHWGYSVKHPLFSAAQPSFRFLPPTSLIGSLAFAVASREGWVEVLVDGSDLYSYTAKLMDDIPWVAYRFLNIDPVYVIETRDLVRTLVAMYVRKNHVYPGSPYLWAVQAHGKIYVPSILIEVLYVIRDGTADKLFKYAWGITRVGTKESLASVKSVELLSAEIEDSTTVSTAFSFARSLAEPVEGNYMVARLPIPDREWYRLSVIRDPSPFLDEHILPRTVVKAKVTERGATLRVGGVGTMIIPKGVTQYG